MITNQAEASISQTLISGNSALGGNGGSGGGGWKDVTWIPGGDGGSAIGGGLEFSGSSLSLIDSSIVQNQAIGGTGANGSLEDTGILFMTTPPTYPYLPVVGQGGSAWGGGLAAGTQCELVSDTVSGNSASGGQGGSGTYTYGVWNDGNFEGYVTIPLVESPGSATGGLSGSAAMDNTIVALNTQGTGSGARPATSPARFPAHTT